MHTYVILHSTCPNIKLQHRQRNSKEKDGIALIASPELLISSHIDLQILPFSAYLINELNQLKIKTTRSSLRVSLARVRDCDYNLVSVWLKMNLKRSLDTRTVMKLYSENFLLSSGMNETYDRLLLLLFFYSRFTKSVTFQRGKIFLRCRLSSGKMKTPVGIWRYLIIRLQNTVQKKSKKSILWLLVMHNAFRTILQNWPNTYLASLIPIKPLTKLATRT